MAFQHNPPNMYTMADWSSSCKGPGGALGECSPRLCPGCPNEWFTVWDNDWMSSPTYQYPALAYLFKTSEHTSIPFQHSWKGQLNWRSTDCKVVYGCFLGGETIIAIGFCTLTSLTVWSTCPYQTKLNFLLFPMTVLVWSQSSSLFFLDSEQKLCLGRMLKMFRHTVATKRVQLSALLFYAGPILRACGEGRIVVLV